MGNTTRQWFGSSLQSTVRKDHNQDRLVRNFLIKDIVVRDKLKNYRDEMNQKYPDPQKKLKLDDDQAAQVKSASKTPQPKKLDK